MDYKAIRSILVRKFILKKASRSLDHIMKCETKVLKELHLFVFYKIFLRYEKKNHCFIYLSEFC